jgi:hypothetical protein
MVNQNRHFFILALPTKPIGVASCKTFAKFLQTPGQDFEGGDEAISTKI